MGVSQRKKQGRGVGANNGQTDGNFTRRIFIMIEWNWYVIFLELIIPVVWKIHGHFHPQSPKEGNVCQRHCQSPN